MCTTFTEHVRTFGPDCDLAACVLPRLEKRLRREMARRQLLTAPPRYLGYPELHSWSVEGAFDDLVADCYLFAIARRIVGLRNQLRVRTDIDGLIAINVRNFLFERQRENDRIGYSTFGNVEAAALTLEEAEELVVDGRVAERFDGSSVLRFPSSDTSEMLAAREQLTMLLESTTDWSDALPNLISTTEQGQLWIANYIRRLGENGITRIRVSDLVSVLAERIRANWSARNASRSSELDFEDGEDEVANMVRLVWPDSVAEDRERCEMLVRTIQGRIDEIEDRIVRGRLTAEVEIIVRIVDNGETPTQADLIRELNIPRNTVSRDFARLREMIQEIQAQSGTTLPENS